MKKRIRHLSKMEINEKTKKELDEARKRIANGEFVTIEAVEKKFGL